MTLKRFEKNSNVTTYYFDLRNVLKMIDEKGAVSSREFEEAGLTKFLLYELIETKKYLKFKNWRVIDNPDKESKALYSKKDETTYCLTEEGKKAKDVPVSAVEHISEAEILFIDSANKKVRDCGRELNELETKAWFRNDKEQKKGFIKYLRMSDRWEEFKTSLKKIGVDADEYEKDIDREQEELEKEEKVEIEKIEEGSEEWKKVKKGLK